MTNSHDFVTTRCRFKNISRRRTIFFSQSRDAETPYSIECTENSTSAQKIRRDTLGPEKFFDSLLAPLARACTVEDTQYSNRVLLKSKSLRS